MNCDQAMKRILDIQGIKDEETFYDLYHKRFTCLCICLTCGSVTFGRKEIKHGHCTNCDYYTMVSGINLILMERN